jgi:hypothetical protein
MISVDVDLDDVDAFLREAVDLPTPALLDLIGGEMVDEVRDSIYLDRGDQYRGERHAPWSESYRRSGAPFSGSHTMLYRSGDMHDSVRHEVDGNAVRIGPDTDRGYGRFHVEGTQSMPRRDFLSAGPRHLERIADTVLSFVAMGLR